MDMGAPTFTSDQMERLAANVRRRLEEIGNSAVRIPALENFRAERHTNRDPDDYFYYDLAVDIDIGPTIITLHVRKEPRRRSGMVDVDDVARSIIMHVLLATSDRPAIEALKSAHKAILAKIKREGSSLAILSVRYGPAEIAMPEALFGRTMWVEVGLLDNLLRPVTEIVTGRGVREICRNLRILGDRHRVRLATLARIAPHGGVLEVDGLAEHAITAAGSEIEEITRVMLAANQAEPAVRVMLSGSEDADHVGVRVSDGRIVLEARFAQCWIGREGNLVVKQGFPEVLLNALPGRRLGDLIAHPLLADHAEIAEVIKASKDFTEFRLSAGARAIRQPCP